MGTRNLTMVVKDNKIKVAQYCQWDGYPTGQGMKVVEFIQKKMNLAAFKQAVDNCRFLKDEQDAKEFNVPDWKTKYPQFLRDTGAKVLSLIQDANGLVLYDQSDFAKDSLFCEWAYLLNLDNSTLEVYKGFNKAPLTGSDRFSTFTDTPDDSGYYPIKLLASIPFEKVTPDLMRSLEVSE